jgi:ribosomal protein L16 Arg81 hydroxylase
MTANLKDLVAPEDVKSFLENKWGRTFTHIQGAPEKFSGLMPWNVLSAILEEHHLSRTRFRLYKKGKELDRSKYEHETGIKFSEFERELAMGATLVIDAIDQFFAPLHDVMVSLQETFHSRTTANLYAAWRRDNGFNLHWDQQDTLILQVSGRKRWKVYSPTDPSPLYPLHKQSQNPPRPSDRPTWNKILNSGHLLHIPRGYWHVAYPLDEPSIHLTITVVPVTGRDVLQWMAGEILSYPEARMNLPQFASRSKQRLWLRGLQNILKEACPDDLLERYVTAADEHLLGRVRSDLPDSVRRTKGRDGKV